MNNDPAISLPQAHAAFTDFLKKQGKSSSTILAYSKDIEQLIKFLEKQNLKETSAVKIEQLKAFIKSLAETGYTAKSVSRKINSIKTFYRFLGKEMNAENVAAALEYPKYENKPPRILSPLEYRALRDAAREDARIYAIIELFLQTGMRISEVANLRLEDIQDESLFIRPLEGRGERMIPLNKPARAALQKYLEDRPGQAKVNNVFVTKNGKPFLIRNIRNSIDRYFKIAGISEAKVNDLRHTWIAHHLQSGTSLLLVNKIAGHKRLTTTERYLELVKDKVSEKTKLEEL